MHHFQLPNLGSIIHPKYIDVNTNKDLKLEYDVPYKSLSWFYNDQCMPPNI